MKARPCLISRHLTRNRLRLGRIAVTIAVVVGSVAGWAIAVPAQAAPPPAGGIVTLAAENQAGTPFPTTVAPGSTTTLTARTSLAVPAPFFLQIFDATTGSRLCAARPSNCSVFVSQPTATTHRYVAYVAAIGTGFPPPSVQNTSNNAFVTWASTGFQISLEVTDFAGNIDAIANTNIDVGPTPYYIEIFNENGRLLHECGFGKSCSVSFFSTADTHLVAFVASLKSSSLPPANTQASSRDVHAVNR